MPIKLHSVGLSQTFNSEISLFYSLRQIYDGLEKKLKEVFSERSSILHQLSKTSKELDSIKGNLQVGRFFVRDIAMFEALVGCEFWAGANFTAFTSSHCVHASSLLFISFLFNNPLLLNINVKIFFNLVRPTNVMYCMWHVTGNAEQASEMKGRSLAVRN